MAHLLPNAYSSPQRYVPPPDRACQNPQHKGGTYSPHYSLDQSPRTMHRDTYQLPPPYPHHGCQYSRLPLTAPAPHRRSAIACTYCRKRKIRCSGYDSSRSGKCLNCVRFNQQCLFHPVSSQAVFVPASIVYGPNTGAPIAGAGGRAEENGQYPCNGEQPPMLYGAYGQPLGRTGPFGPYQLSCPPQGFPAQNQHYPVAYYTPPEQPNEQHGPGSFLRDQDERVGLKRPPPGEECHSGNCYTSQSPHPNVRPSNSMYDQHTDSGKSGSHPGPPNLTTSSPAIPSIRHPFHSSQTYANDNKAQQCGGSPPAQLVSHATCSFYSPDIGPMRDDDKTPLSGQIRSTSSPVTGQTGMRVQDLLQRYP